MLGRSLDSITAALAGQLMITVVAPRRSSMRMDCSASLGQVPPARSQLEVRPGRVRPMRHLDRGGRGLLVRGNPAMQQVGIQTVCQGDGSDGDAGVTEGGHHFGLE